MKEIIELLDRNGWNVECESPFEIRERETGDFASGYAARSLVEAIRHEDGLTEQKEEAQNTAKIVGEWLEFVKFHTDYTKKYPNWPSYADVVHSSLLQRMLMGEKPLPADEYANNR